MVINLGGKRSSHGIGRTLIRTPAAIGTGIEIEHMLPGKIFQSFNTKGLKVIQLFVFNSVLNRFDIPFFELSMKKDVKNRGDNMEMFAHGQKSKKEKRKKDKIMDIIHEDMRSLEKFQGNRGEHPLENPNQGKGC